MDIIKKIYYDVKTGYKNPHALLNEVQKYDKDVKYNDVLDFLNRQEEYQINKKKLKKTYFQIGAQIGYYQMDLILLPNKKSENDGYGYILTIIEIATRKAYVYLLRTKKASEMLKVLKDFITKNKDRVVGISSDSGGEFLNAKIIKLMKDNGIYYTQTQKGDHNRQSIVERFNYTLRNKLNKYLTANKTEKYYDVIHDIVENYNNTIHSGLNNKTPNFMFENNEETKQMNEDKMRDNAYLKANIMSEYKIGDRVRIKKTKSSMFEKDSNTFSPGIYHIDNIVGNKFAIKNSSGDVLKRLYSINEILKIGEVEKIDNKI